MAYTTLPGFTRPCVADGATFTPAQPLRIPGKSMGLWTACPYPGTPNWPGATAAPRPAVVLSCGPPNLESSHIQQIPEPPMGKIAVLTIPAIYFRTTNRPKRGQLWPRTR